MQFIKNLIPFNTSIDFVKYSKVALKISFTLMILSLISLVTKGINFGIDFTGGTVIEIKSAEEINLETIKKLLEKHNLEGASVQHFDNNQEIFIKLKQPENVINKLKHLFELNNFKFDYRKVDYVGAQVSSDMIIKGIVAICFALLGIIIYLWIRFGIGFSLVGATLLVHDVLIIIGFFSATQLEFNLPSVAALLTIIGYSINDTVVIFDRLRSNLRTTKENILPKVINLSINATLSRTILTSFTTVLAALPMLLLASGEIQNFILVITIGIVVGTYSSILLAPQGLLYAKIIKKEKSLKLPDITSL